jgi:hypothetical protein
MTLPYISCGSQASVMPLGKNGPKRASPACIAMGTGAAFEENESQAGIRRLPWAETDFGHLWALVSTILT